MANPKELFTLRSYCVEESVGYLLGRARAKLVKAIDCELSAYDITHGQGRIMMLLSSGQYATAAELAREAYVDSASMTRMVDRLEKRDLIERVRCGEDRRVCKLRLTTEGQALADQLPTVYRRVLNHNFVGFSANEVDTLKTLLRKILDNEVSESDKAE